jgi:hypothetical protein
LQNPLATPASSVNWALNWRLQKVARKSKTSGKETDPTGLDPVARATDGTVAPKPRRKTVPQKKKNPPRKKPASPGKLPPPKPTSGGAIVTEPSDEEIRIRAYFIAERRAQLSLQGDSAHDWIEAKRQLLEEAKRTAS